MRKAYAFKFFVYLKQNKIIKTLKKFFYKLYLKQNVCYYVKNYYKYKRNKIFKNKALSLLYFLLIF